MRITRNNLIKLLASLLVSALVVFFLSRQVKFQDIIHVLSGINIRLALVGLFFYFFMVILRATRFQVFFRGEISSRQLLSIASLHNFFNEFLPLRSGELVYLYLIRKSRISGSRNLSSLIIIRLMDFVFVILIAFSAMWLLARQDGLLVDISQYSWSLPLLLLIGMLVFIFFIKYFHPLLNIFFRLFKGIAKIQNKLRWVEDKAEELTTVLKKIWNKKFAWQIITRSFVLWIIVIISYYFILSSLGLSITLWQMAFVIMFPAIVTVLPVQGAAGVGTFEAAIGLGLISIGVGVETAIVVSFAMHVVLWLFALISGVIGYFVKV